MKRSGAEAGLLLALGGDEGARLPRLGWWLLAAVAAALLGFRLFLALATDFPIGDGALFLKFIEAIAETFPRLPAHVFYNGLDIPFAYPPLSFWTAAGLAQAGADPLTILHLAPIAMNAAYVLLFAWLLLRHRHSPLFAAIALLVTFTALRSFEWLVMGGGLSRGAGSLFFLLTLIAAGLPPAWQARSDAAPPARRLIAAGLAIGLAILSHLEWGILATGSFIAARALAVRTLRRFVIDNVMAGTAALAVVLPWLGIVIVEHGPAPFFAASGSSDWSPVTSVLKILATLIGNAANLFLLLGIFVLIARRDWFWLVFACLCMVLTPRSGDTTVVLAIGVLSAHGVFAFAGLLGRVDLTGRKAAGATALLLLLVVGNQIRRGTEMSALVRPLSQPQRAAMAWVRAHHSGQTYAVLTNRFWFYDASAEWLPSLTGTRSVTTVQGREWLPDQAYRRWDEMNAATLDAASCSDLRDALRAFGAANYVWVEWRSRCFRVPGYRPVYRNERVTIFEVTAR